MKTAMLAMIVLGEVLSIGTNTAEVSVMEWEGENVRYVTKVLSLKEFPCNPYPDMLFYYTSHGKLRCGEPEPN